MEGSHTSLAKAQSQLTLVLIAVLAIIFLPTPGTADVFDWLDWGRNVYEHGLVDGYAINHHEHPPYFSVILYSAMAIANTAGVAPFYGLKITFLLALLLSTSIIYFWSQRNAAITLIFFIPLAYSCLTLSYMDIYFTPFFLLSIYFISKKQSVPAAIFFMAATLVKYPPLTVAPFFLIYAYAHFRSISINTKQTIEKLALLVITPMSLMALVTFLIFGNEFFSSIFRIFGHNCLSCGALNFNRLLPVIVYALDTDQNPLLALVKKINVIESQPLPDIATLYTAALAIFSAFYLATIAVFMSRKKDVETLLVFCILGQYSYFIFSKGVHENHLYLSMLIAMCLAIINEKFMAMALNIIMISSMNMFVNYGINGMTFDLWWTRDYYNGEIQSLSWLNAGYPFDKTLIFALFNVIYFLVFWLMAIKKPAIAIK